MITFKQWLAENDEDLDDMIDGLDDLGMASEIYHKVVHYIDHQHKPVGPPFGKKGDISSWKKENATKGPINIYYDDEKDVYVATFRWRTHEGERVFNYRKTLVYDSNGKMSDIDGDDYDPPHGLEKIL